jgi:cyclic pyranopterin phosphate synthase
MIDISEKEIVSREATAKGKIRIKSSTASLIINKGIKKGDVMEVARISGIMAAKNTPEIIPHCHQIPLDSVDPHIEIHKDSVEVQCTVKANYKTGVEMEALSCVSAMLLTIWDMVKYLEKDETGNYPNTAIETVKVVEKRKGRNGTQ